MTLMDSLIRGSVGRPPRITIYGSGGVGKTTLASKADKAVFICTEDGMGELETPRFPLSKSFAEVWQAIAELKTAKHDFRWVIVDSLDWLEKLIWAEVCRSKNVDSVESLGYGKGYVLAAELIMKILNALDELRMARNMGIILIAHAKVERVEDPRLTDPYDRYSPKLHKHSNAQVIEWSDHVLMAAWKVFTKKTEGEGFKKAKTTGIGTGERVLYCEERPSHIAKNRLGLPAEIPMDWDQLSSYFSKSNKKSAKAKQAEAVEA